MTGIMTVVFSAGGAGEWAIDRIIPIRGHSLASAPRLAVSLAEAATDAPGVWQLRGVVGHTRYSKRTELSSLNAVSPALGRIDAVLAALIPIRKSPNWWALAQDERRAIFEERSQHIARSLRHLPAVARRLHHCRDLGEPFDFLTWFEFAPEYADDFADLLAELRTTEEWEFVEREIEIRLLRDHG